MIVKIILILAFILAGLAFAQDPYTHWYLGVGLLVSIIFFPALMSWVQNWDHINRKW